MHCAFPCQSFQSTAFYLHGEDSPRCDTCSEAFVMMNAGHSF